MKLLIKNINSFEIKKKKKKKIEKIIIFFILKYKFSLQDKVKYES
jgi:hypothetical protein